MKQRDTSLDHFKFFLIACVVFGHLIEPSFRLDAVTPVYNFIYLFHIPAFVFICGLFTKPDRMEPRLVHLAVLLLIFQILYLVLLPSIGVEQKGGIMRPYWVLWFLLSLICWTAMAPIIIKSRWPLLIAVLLALTAGIFDKIGYTLSLSRTIYFFPFFVAGLCYGSKIIDTIKTASPWWGVAGLVFCLMLLLAQHPVDERLFYGGRGYEHLGQGIPDGAIIRLGMMCLSFIALASLVRLMPGKPSLFSRLGAGSLAVFLLHGFIVLPLRPVMEVWFKESVWLGYGTAFALTFIITLALAQPFWTRLLNTPLLLFKKEH